jgi:sulfocyanin
MWYDAAAKRVTLKVDAAFGSGNGGMNFNGGFSGHHTIVIPRGWTVHMRFLNKDAIPHSALIIAAGESVPSVPDQPAIPRAYTRDLIGGIFTDGTDESTFRASRAGDYFLACGVPGHAASGMYIRFTVSDTASVPAYRM